MKLVASYDLASGDGYDIILEENGKYHICKNDTEIVQPNHDAEGIIRYLAHALHNSEYMRKKGK